ILAIDAMALLLVLASGPAAYLWLDQSHPGPVATAASTALPAPTAVADASPGAGVGSQPAVVPGGSTTPGPSLVFGTGAWKQVDSQPQAAWASASVRLHDGRIMVIGGAASQSSFDAVATAATFDPATGRWSRVTDMLQRRAYATAVTLADGSVLVAGGSRDGQPLDTAERYIPDSGTWVAAGRLNLPRTQGELTLLADGRALATGGGIEGGPTWTATASAEIFNPKTSQWTLVPPMSVARVRHTAVLLPSGDVFVTGGATTYHLDAGKVTSSAEVFSPRTNSWRPAASMSEPRYVQESVLLHDGRVLVAGGWYAMSNSDPSHETAEIYDPASDRWSTTGSMKTARAEYGLVILADGRVLAAGGTDKSYKLTVTTEIFDPATGSWTATGDLKVATMWSAIQTLADGRVLISGGGLDASATRVTAVCEIYTPAPR
ncbi:MAG TPA: kelch repeat-containing protein, partial [Candidatus Limnocylindrales bacterium]